MGKCSHPFPLHQKSRRLFWSGCDWSMDTPEESIFNGGVRGQRVSGGDNVREGTLNSLDRIP